MDPSPTETAANVDVCTLPVKLVYFLVRFSAESKPCTPAAVDATDVEPIATPSAVFAVAL